MLRNKTDFEVRVRSKSYETNSSSQHSLTLVKDDIIERSFDHDGLRRGFIRLHPNPDGYGSGMHRYYRPDSILSYFVALAYGEWIKMPEMAEKDILPILREKPAVDKLVRFMEKDSGCKFEFIYPKETSFSMGIWVDSKSELMSALEDMARLKAVMYGRKSYLETRYDSDTPGMFIMSDIGEVLYDSSIVRENHSLARTFRLSVSEEGRLVDYIDDEGHAHGPKLPPFDLHRLFGSNKEKIDIHITACSIDMTEWQRRAQTEPDYSRMAQDMLFGVIHSAKDRKIGAGSGRLVTVDPKLDISLAFNGFSKDACHDYSDANSFAIEAACDDETLEIVRRCLVDAYSPFRQD